MKVFNARDRGEIIIASELSHQTMQKISNNVFGELSQIIDKNIHHPKKIDNLIKIDSIESTKILKESAILIERELVEWSQGYSALRWLWMIRRLPSYIFAGSLGSTGAYHRSLAEIISAKSKKTSSGLRVSNNEIHYDLHGATPGRLARFCGGVRYLSHLHSCLRWAGKGAEFKFPKNKTPEIIVEKELEKAVELYDSRWVNKGLPFSRGGTKLVDVATASTSYEDIIVRVDPTDHQYADIPSDVLQSFGESFPQGSYLNLGIRFITTPFSLAPLKKLQQNQILLREKGWANDVGLLLLLLRIAAVYLEEHQVGRFSLLTRGYLLIPRSKFIKMADIFLESNNSWVHEILESKHNPSSGISFLESLESLEGSSYPLNPGPVVRVEKDCVCLDFVAATQRFENSLEYPSAEGAIANSRASHFEYSVQELIDSSQWKPRSKIAALRGRTLRSKGEKITDIDSIGEKDGRLLIIDCKSLIYNSQYDAGDFQSVRNAQSQIIGKVKKWQAVRERLKKYPVGDNFNFSVYSDILALVCTPSIFFVPIGIATEEIYPNLRTVSSLGELESWLKGGSSK